MYMYIYTISITHCFIKPMTLNYVMKSFSFNYN